MSPAPGEPSPGPEESSPPSWIFTGPDAHALWPALPDANAGAVLALLFQMEQAQWIKPAEIARRQEVQLAAVLRHAHDSVPYYRSRWQGVFDPGAPVRKLLARLPTLQRGEVRQHYAEFKTERFPASHGAITEGQTSGSTGMPLRFLKTTLTDVLWRAFTLREHLWQRRDLGTKLASMRRGAAGRLDNWGAATRGLIHTGPCVASGLDISVEEQLRWLQAELPRYLLTYPTNARALALHALQHSIRLPGLRQVRTLGEPLPPDLKMLVRQAWNADVADSYSAEETGYIALQCPRHEHYHVLSEGVLVEVLNKEDLPCRPGESGRLVITTLHNFAMPLVRYEIEDHAQVGEMCDCGRGLPVINRILGRTRNMLVTAQGQRYWPAVGSEVLADFAQIRQFQLAQISFDLLELRLASSSALPPEAENRVREHVLSRLPPGMTLRFAYRERIHRGNGGKFEDFVCELDESTLATMQQYKT